MVDSFRAKDVLKAPVAMRGGGCSSGVSGVVMYNAGPKHALVALLPRSCSGGFDALGSGARPCPGRNSGLEVKQEERGEIREADRMALQDGSAAHVSMHVNGHDVGNVLHGRYNRQALR